MRRETEFAAKSVKLKNQEAKLKNFCKQTERRLDTTRTGVFASQSGMGFGHSTSMKAVWANKKSLTAGKNSDTIKEKSKSAITKISDGAIARVPKVSIAGFTDAQNAFIQEQHKELLKYARDNNDSKEVAFVFNSRLEKVGTYKGSDDKIMLGNALYGSDLIVLHNHPRNSSFSDMDIQLLIYGDNVKSITVVKNNGGVETLTKTNRFDSRKADARFKSILRANVKSGTPNEVLNAVSVFLKRYKEGLTWQF